MLLSLALRFGLLAGVALTAGDQCRNDEPVQGSSVLQRGGQGRRVVAALVEDAEDAEDAAAPAEDADADAAARQKSVEGARFLLQATFGPTRASLKELGKTSPEAWLQQQMRLPVESHREYFRARANPASDPTNQVGFSERSPCSKGSRWVSFALRQSDVGRAISVSPKTGGGLQVLVEGSWRTDLDPAHKGNGLAPAACTDEPKAGWSGKGITCSSRGRRISHMCNNPKVRDFWEGRLCRQSCFDLGYPYPGDDCSGGWASLAASRSSGYVCKVDGIGNGTLVALGADQACKSLMYLRNPSIWVASSSQAFATDLPFGSNPKMPGVAFLQRDAPGCELGKHGAIRSGGAVYVADRRMSMQENTLAGPGTFDSTNCPARTPFNGQSCRVLPESPNGCALACGSPGEIANSPEHGHHLPVCTRLYKEMPDMFFDNRFSGVNIRKMGKSVVWTTLALKAEDQLRQRMAWALSQIYVTGVTKNQWDTQQEFWLAYYDIFVRGAFGPLRDVLLEVTYSPLMGEYLSFLGSRSYDSSGSYPDENYAREIMQLFTIGLFELHPNGSAVTDAAGNDVPTYTNEHIMNFARVFTGFRRQSARSNMEIFFEAHNWIDPMRIEGTYHDRYPKPDLFGNYLGDGYPLCADLPKLAFLAAGAKYEFLGYSHSGTTLALGAGSQLYAALCAERGGVCAFAAAVELPAALPCHGEECSAPSLEVVRVGRGFFRYAAPPCVHLFFSRGQVAASPTKTWQRHCMSPDIPAAAVACCSGCTNIPHPWMARKGHACETADQTWLSRGQPVMTTKKCNKVKSWRTRKSCALACARAGVGYAGDDCSAGAYSEALACGQPHERMTHRAAEAYCASRNMSVCGEPRGSCGAGLYVWTDSACDTTVRVHGDGKVSGNTPDLAQNLFAVAWAQGAPPAPGDYTADVRTEAVFRRVPAKAELLLRLRVGAPEPEGSCVAGCGGEVRAYGRSAAIDESTVFECDGAYYKNVESLVHVGGSAFRNPPVFLPPGSLQPSDRALELAANHEVRSLVDHLLHHPSTPAFIGKKLIQRFVTSNPSPEYLSAVARAFREGEHRGTRYSGEYGDLGATLAAVLLHPEARAQGSAQNGLLREPMLKLIHVLRSMDYADKDQDHVVLKILDEAIGQFPYHSPTVFNYYMADFKPSRFRGGMGSPEPEAEPEPEPEAEPEPEPEPLVAPEFQVFTPPTAINFLNGMNVLLEKGANGCTDGFLQWDRRSCYQGELNFSASGDTAAEAVGELDLLLTAGRLSPENLAVVRGAYDSAAQGEKLKAAQQAIVFTPEFNNLGDPQPNGTRSPKAPGQDKTAKDYRAVVMLFLLGGADTFHLLAPVGCRLYNEYKAVRTGAAHEQDKLHPIKPRSKQSCGRFGLHPDLPFLADLYENKRQAAFVSNVGALIEPVTKSTMKERQTCQGMFSHSHQQSAAMTLECQIAGGAPVGVGGRMGDALASQGHRVESFSVSGMARWSEGVDTKIEIISRKEGAVRFSAYNEWKHVIGNVTRQTYGNVYCEEYAQALGDAVMSSEALGAVLENVKLNTTYATDTKLAEQLHQVARLIAARAERKAERDLFFVTMGGFDTHANLHGAFSENMKELDAALRGFVAELEAQKVFDSTLLVTASDFGRTLTYNGFGTDHGWGGNHFVLGGSVRGGKIYNEFPKTLALGGEYDAGRGRVIPQYPWESMMVPIAEWMGVAAPEGVFPNLGNFNRSTHIIATDALFKGQR